MTREFDPYHKWLAIPPEEQPPNLYRLLGLQLFEEDVEVVDSAADKCMAHLRSFQSGKNAKRAEDLLNEVSAARVCLLDEHKRLQYDEKLRQQLAGAPQVSASLNENLNSGIEQELAVTEMPPNSMPVLGNSLSANPVANRIKRGPGWGVISSVVGAVVFVLIIGIVWKNYFGGQQPNDEHSNGGDVAQNESASPKKVKQSGGSSKLGSAKYVPAQSESIDLLKLIDPAKHLAQGKWSRISGRLVSSPKVMSIIWVPLNEVPREYDLHVSVIRLRGQNTFGVGVVFGDARTLVAFNAHNGKNSGFEFLDGKHLHKNETVTKKGNILPGGVREVVIRVRDEGISVDLEGKTIIDWKGKSNRLSETSKTPAGKLYLYSINTEYEVRSFRLKPVQKSR